jgi:hypothetical protein
LIDVTSACLGGASAMNFALKAYLSVIEPNTFVTMWGFVIPGKFAACAELLIIHLLNPHAPSLVYHAVGLAVGVLFARARFGGMAEKLIRRLKKVSGSLLERARGARPRGPGRPDPPPGVREARAAAAAAAQARATTFPGRVFAGLRRRRNANKSASDASNASSSVSLPPGTRVVLAGLRAADMNGSWGVVKGPDVAAVGRVRVALDSGSEFSVLPEKCVVVDAAE